MLNWPPANQPEQNNIWEYEAMVPAYTDPDTGEPLPSCSYRARWNERTESWTCDWFDETGAPIDQGRRLSCNWWMRTPWQNGLLPDPMPAWLMFSEDGDTGAEATYESLGRGHKIAELENADVEEFSQIDDIPITITIP